MLFEHLTERTDELPHPAAFNMAIDEMLLRRAVGPVLRIYRFERPAVSFGYFSPYAPVEAQWPERDCVRRWTGGGVVLHGGDLTYTLVVPRAVMGALESRAGEFYRAVHQRIAGLICAGVATELAPAGAAKISDACFENPAEHDVMAGGRKIAGAAQRRTRHGLLHQGSIQAPELTAHLRAHLAGSFARVVERRGFTEDELREAREIAAARYGTAAWNHRV